MKYTVDDISVNTHHLADCLFLQLFPFLKPVKILFTLHTHTTRSTHSVHLEDQSRSDIRSSIPTNTSNSGAMNAMDIDQATGHGIKRKADESPPHAADFEVNAILTLNHATHHLPWNHSPNALNPLTPSLNTAHPAHKTTEKNNNLPPQPPTHHPSSTNPHPPQPA